MNALLRIYRIIIKTLKRFIEDRCDVEARALSFVSLLSLIPFFSVILLELSKFSFYPYLKDELFKGISNYIFPEMAVKIVNNIDKMLGNTGSIGFFGILITVGIAFMLFIALSRTMNHIWRIGRSYSVLFSFLKFIIIVICTPVFLVATFYLQNFINLQKYISYIPDFLSLNYILSQIFSLVLHWILLFVVYSFIPHRRIKFIHSFTAGIICGSLWYLLRRGLNIYVKIIPQINILYGSLAFIPIFLIWIYCTWIIVLLGVELNYTFHFESK